MFLDDGELSTLQSEILKETRHEVDFIGQMGGFQPPSFSTPTASRKKAEFIDRTDCVIVDGVKNLRQEIEHLKLLS